MSRIIIGHDDLPSAKQLEDTVSRLEKDVEILSRVKGNKDSEDPKALRVVASFLKMIANREKNNLPKK